MWLWVRQTCLTLSSYLCQSSGPPALTGAPEALFHTGMQVLGGEPGMRNGLV